RRSRRALGDPVRIRSRRLAAVTMVTALALGAAFAFVSILFIRAQVREADALLVRVAKTEAREVAEQDLSFNAGPGPAQSDIGPMVMSGVIYDADGRVREATKPFDRIQP